MGRSFRLIVLHCRVLADHEVGNSAAHARVGDPERRPSDNRLEAAGEFVFALRARFEALQAMADAVLDPLVVAKLEVQTG